jgi:hypothetical protein
MRMMAVGFVSPPPCPPLPRLLSRLLSLSHFLSLSRWCFCGALHDISEARHGGVGTKRTFDLVGCPGIPIIRPAKGCLHSSGSR